MDGECIPRGLSLDLHALSRHCELQTKRQKSGDQYHDLKCGELKVLSPGVKKLKMDPLNTVNNIY